MRCVDVNVLVNAHRPEAPLHEQCRQWLDEARRDDQPLGISDVVLSGFLRVVTHPRVFREPTPLAVALNFSESVRTAPACTRLEPGERHWHIFTDLCREVDAKGNLAPDAFLAAIAIENNAVLVTSDRGFRRFPQLRIEHPTDRP
jgi:toxin-antitoxin system PIN domain toxin